MKKLRNICLFLAGVSIVASCVKQNAETPALNKIPVTLNGVSTKVALNPGVGEGSMAIYTPVWQKGDAIAIFAAGAAAGSNEKFAVSDITTEGVAGNFSGSLSVNPDGGAYTLYAVQPYLGSDESNTDYFACKCEIPAVQHPAADNIDSKSYIAVSYPVEGVVPAASKSLDVDGLMFKRVTAPLVLAIKAKDAEGVKATSVTIKAESTVILSGKCSVNLENGEIVAFSESSSEVTAQYAKASAPSVSDFNAWFMVKPQILAAGSILEVVVTAGEDTYIKNILVPEGGIELSNNTVTRINVEVEKKIVETWKDVTKQFNLPANMTIYKSENLHERNGNIGFVVKIAAGQIDAKSTYNVVGNQTWFDPVATLSDYVKANSGYSLFTVGLDVSTTRPVALVTSINNGAVDGVDNTPQGTGKATSYLQWGAGRVFYCPPTVGIKDGKAEIHYASVLEGDVLNKFDEPKGDANLNNLTGGIPWSVDCAFSGYAYVLKEGVMQVEDNEASYKALCKKERLFYLTSTCNNIQTWTNQKIMYNGSEVDKIDTYKTDGLRMARNLFGVDAEGNLYLFISQRYSNPNNSLVNNSDPSDGSTIYEAALSLKDKFGCTDAMVMQSLYYAIASIQDGGNGADLTRTYYREHTERKLSHIVMFK